LAGSLILGGVGTSGCRQIEALRGPGYPESDEEIPAKLRSQKSSDSKSPERYFFDERASQIERHLGL